MTGHVRKFTEEEDAMIFSYHAGTGLGLKPLAKLLHTGKNTIQRREAELLGLAAPPLPADDIMTRPITVGDDDPLLKRLQKVHAGRE